MTPFNVFLCGCDPNDPHVKNYSSSLVMVNGQQVLTNKRYDKEGREICPIHGKQKYGHATPRMQGPQGNDIADLRAENKLIYGDKPLGEIHSTVSDRRDNRDPAVVGMEFLSRKNGAAEAVEEISAAIENFDGQE